MCESCSNITISGNNFINFRRRRYPAPPSLPQPCRRRFCIGNGIRQRLQPSSGQTRTVSGGGLCASGQPLRAVCRLRQGVDHQPELLACTPPVARVAGVVELPEVVVDSIDDGLAQLLACLPHGIHRIQILLTHGVSCLMQLVQPRGQIRPVALDDAVGHRIAAGHARCRCAGAAKVAHDGLALGRAQQLLQRRNLLPAGRGRWAGSGARSWPGNRGDGRGRQMNRRLVRDGLGGQVRQRGAGCERYVRLGKARLGEGPEWGSCS